MSVRAEKMREYRRAYWRRYKEKNRRVYGTLSKAEYAEISAIARENGRSIWGEIWSEATAYRQQSYLPSKEIAKRIAMLYTAQRRIGNNLNQLAKKAHLDARLASGEDVNDHLRELEQAIEDFVSQPWTRTSGTSSRGVGDDPEIDVQKNT